MKKVLSIVAIASLAVAVVACGPSKAELEKKAQAMADSMSAAATADSVAAAAFSQKAIIYKPLCEQIDNSNICKQKADVLFDIFKKSKAFDWTDGSNNCEDRANAVSLILDSWGIPNGKSWIFQGSTFDNTRFKGTMADGKYLYGYHVACCILVKNRDMIDTLIIDPLMDSTKLLALQEWADLVATTPMNIYVVTSNKYYLKETIDSTHNWILRDDFFDDTIDGLTKYNQATFLQRYKTKKYLKRRPLVLNEFNLLRNRLPEKIQKINCN